MRKLLTRKSLVWITLTVVMGAIMAGLTVRGSNQSNQFPCPTPSPVETPAKEENLKPGNLSPYDIRNFVDSDPQRDLTVLWDRLSIKTINISESQQLDPGNFKFLTKCAACEAELFHHELDGEPGNEVIVRVQDQVWRASRYLIFKELDEPVGEWKLLGHVDNDLNKYRMAQHTVVASGGRSWLVVTGQGASGSGVSLYVSRIFLSAPDGLKEILSYVAEGYQAGHFDDPTRQFFASVRSCEIADGVATIEIVFSAKYFVPDYSNNSARIHLFTKTQKAVFTRQLENQEQRLDAGRSEVTERELEDVYYIDSLSNEEFLIYNFEELAKIAGGNPANNDSRKEWLRRFLAKEEKTQQRERLQGFLKID